MKRRTLTPDEQLWQQVWRVWPDAMEYQQGETPFDAPFRTNQRGNERGRAWLRDKQRQIDERSAR